MITGILFYFTAIALGAMVGAATGLTGTSGVIIVVPFLLYAGLSFPSCVGSSLLVDLITSSSVVYQYFTHNNVSWKVAVSMGAGAILGAWTGARASVSLPQGLLVFAFSLFSFTMGFEFCRRAVKEMQISTTRLRVSRRRAYFIAFTASIGIGLLTGTLGASGGMMFFALSMALFSSDVRLMIGTATLAMMLSASSGVLSYAMLGRVDLLDSVVIGAASLMSGYVFASYAQKISQKTINAFLSALFFCVGILVLFKAL